jgi:hypothetical protein
MNYVGGLGVGLGVGFGLKVCCCVEKQSIRCVWLSDKRWWYWCRRNWTTFENEL